MRHVKMVVAKGSTRMIASMTLLAWALILDSPGALRATAVPPVTHQVASSASDAAGSVTLSFPSFSIGKLYYLTWIGGPINNEFGIYPKPSFAAAQNKVIVPANSKIRLLLNNSGLTSLKIIPNLPSQIMALDAHGVDKFGDEATRYLARAKSLEQLDLGDDDVTDEGLATLWSNKTLNDLKLPRTNITGKGLSNLKKLPRLRRLALNGTRIDDAALAQLVPIQTLQVLLIGNCHLSDKGVESIAQLKALTNLSLSGNRKITNASIALLQKLPVLYKLELDQTGVNSGAIPALAKLKGLHRLVINLPDEDLARLKRAIPQCDVTGGVQRIAPEFFAPLK